MRIKSPFLILLLSLMIVFFIGLLAPVDVPAQVDEKEKAAAERKRELERKTLALLDEVAAGAWSLKLAENRSFVLTTAADLLWTHDEKRARNLFWEALNSLGLQTNPPLDDSTNKDSAAKGPVTKRANNDRTQRYFQTFAARREFLRKVARRDPQLALDMLRATHQQQPPGQTEATYRLPDESDLEQEIAGEAVARDPKRALQIARESLAKGLSFQLGNLLFQLNQQDQNAASELAGDIIAKLNTENLETSVDAPILAMQLLQWSRTGGAVLVVANAPVNSPLKMLKLSDEQKQSLVEMITNAALSVSAKENILQMARFMMPEIEQFAPDRAAKLKAKLADLNRTLNKSQRDWNTYESLFEKATPEEMIKAAGRLSEDAGQSLYREAVIKAVISGREDALREFINNQIEEDSRKNSLLDSLDAEQISAAAHRGKTEELQKLLPLIRRKEQRAMAMAELAILLEKKGEHDEAVKLLDDAQALVKVDLRSESQSNALMAFMLAYALVNPAKAFAIIEPIVDRANDDISKLLLLDRIVKSGATKNGEIVMQQPGIPLDFAMFKYGPGIVALANADFNRTKSLADRFQRNELRLMARLLLAQALLHSDEQIANQRAQ